ncbi:MAG: radical SAM protein [archaeon]
MKPRVLLVNPPAIQGNFVREGRCMNRQSAWGSIWPPLTLMYISAVLRKAGYRTMIADSNVGSPESFWRRIGEFRPELSIISTSTPTIDSDVGFAGTLKRKFSSKTALVGTHPTATWRELLCRPSVDFVVRGEPEQTCLELASFLGKRGKGSPGKIRGLAWKAGRHGRPVSNLARKFLSNLDRLPFPDRDSIDNTAYRMPLSGRSFSLLSTSRGCPYCCTFCVASIFYGKSFRKRSAGSIADEIEICKRKYGIENFLFWADEFTFDRRQVREICREIKSRKLKISWFANSRVDSGDYALFREMRESGCFLVSFGIESASQKILDNARKGATVERALSAVRDAKRAGLEVIGHFIFGLPGETKETLRATTDLAKRSGVDYAQFYAATPYPGTVFYERCRKGNLIAADADFSEMEISRAAIRQGELSADELSEARRRAYAEFYLRPSYFIPRILSVLFRNGPKGLLDSFDYLSDWGGLAK